MKLLNLGIEKSPGEQKLLDFLDDLKDKTGIDRKVADLMHFFKFKKKQVYSHGNNVIETITKENGYPCFIDVRLVDNSYRYGLQYFNMK